MIRSGDHFVLIILIIRARLALKIKRKIYRYFVNSTTQSLSCLQSAKKILVLFNGKCSPKLSTNCKRSRCQVKKRAQYRPSQKSTTGITPGSPPDLGRLTSCEKSGARSKAFKCPWGILFNFQIKGKNYNAIHQINPSPVDKY